MPDVLLNNLDPAVCLSELANVLCRPDLELPIHVVRRRRHSTDIIVNCLESDDLQGFRPLAETKIGEVFKFISCQ